MTESRTTDGSGDGGTEERARPAVRCGWCGRRLPSRSGPGRPRRFCRQGCRQQAHLARKLAAAHGLDDSDVVVARDDLEALQGALYCLHAALEDIDRDLSGPAADDPEELRQALTWLRANAEPLVAIWIEPRTVDA